MCTMLNAFHCIPDHLKTQKMCIKVVGVDPSFLQLVPDHFKMQGICDKAVRDDSCSLQSVPAVCSLWHDDYNDDDGGHWDDDEDKFFDWYGGYKKLKAQRAKIKKELMPITWHPSRY